MPETEDLYEILQLHPSAHPDVIQAAYRRLALLYHPDRNPSQEAAEVMKRLNLAYETLSDQDRRAAYDRTRGGQQRQRAETSSYGTHSGRPRTSSTTNGPTSQSRASTQTTPPEPRNGKAFKIADNVLLGGIVIGGIIALAIIANAGWSDGGDEGARSVVSSPIWTPIPAKTTPVPASGATTGMEFVAPTALPTQSLMPDSATMVEKVRSDVVRIETPVGGGIPGYFSRGSSQDDVLHVQGTPTRIDTWEALGYEHWYYDWSKITFSLPDGRVSEWDNDGNLKVRLLPKTSQSAAPGYFTRGSSQDDVLHVQGTPTRIDTWEALGYEHWYYDWSKVTFSLPDGQVSEWDNDGNLKVRLLPKTSQSAAPGYFTRGSSQEDVLHVQGTPTRIDTWEALGYEHWYYDRSKVTFSLPDGLVSEWDNDGNLKVR